MNQLIQTLSIFDHVSHGVQVIDQEYRYCYLNEKILKESGLTLESAIGKTMQEKFPGVEESDAFKAIKRCLESKEQQFFINEYTFPDGSRHIYELELQPIELGVLIISKNITQEEKGIKILQESNRKLEEKIKTRTKELKTDRLHC